MDELRVLEARPASEHAGVGASERDPFVRGPKAPLIVLRGGVRMERSEISECLRGGWGRGGGGEADGGEHGAAARARARARKEGGAQRGACILDSGNGEVKPLKFIFTREVGTTGKLSSSSRGAQRVGWVGVGERGHACQTGGARGRTKGGKATDLLR